MTDAIVILSTCAGEEEAGKLARLLVDRRVAACVNVLPGIRSYYRWKGEIESAAECLLVVKSSRALFAEVRDLLQSAHSYDLPEVIALPIVDGSEDYLTWMSANLRITLGDRS